MSRNCYFVPLSIIQSLQETTIKQLILCLCLFSTYVNTNKLNKLLGICGFRLSHYFEMCLQIPAQCFSSFIVQRVAGRKCQKNKEPAQTDWTFFQTSYQKKKKKSNQLNHLLMFYSIEEGKPVECSKSKAALIRDTAT